MVRSSSIRAKPRLNPGHLTLFVIARHITAPEPDGRLALSVAVSHPVHGEYFIATLRAVRSRQASLRNEDAGLAILWRYAGPEHSSDRGIVPCDAHCVLVCRYGYQPQRVAFWIYWQAVKLLWRGATFYAPPALEVAGAHLVRRRAGWPWSVQQ